MSDERLLRTAAKGDTDALEELVRRLSPVVYRYLMGMLGDDHEADEALQETFVRVARAVERYDPGSDVTGWTLGIARRVVLDIRPTPSSPAGTYPSGPEEELEWARRTLRALPVQHREFLVCREVLGWEPSRIAEVLGLPLDEVREQLRAAREELTARTREVV